jgi:hypothetical protein
MMTGKLYKVIDVTGLLYQGAFDGMTFNSDYTILYGTRNSFNPSDVYQTVFAMSSCDYWGNATLVYSFQVYCGNTNPPAVQLITNGDDEDMIVMCGDGFGAGPYSVLKVANVNSVVANQPISAGTCASTSTTSSSSSDNKNPARNTGIAIGVGIAIIIAYLGTQYALRKLYPPKAAESTGVGVTPTDSAAGVAMAGAHVPTGASGSGGIQRMEMGGH